jgi:signal peptidase I
MDATDPIYVAPKPSPLKRFGWELIQTFALMLVLFLGIRGIVQNFRVEGPSMQPTLTTGEYLWVNKAAYYESQWRLSLGGPSAATSPSCAPE